MKEITPTQVWDLSASILHNKEYRKKYAVLLSKIIKDKGKSILDTACGTGFPSLDLLEKGFLNLTCSDADKESLQILKKKLKEKGFKIPVIQSDWKNILKKIKKRFDVVLCVDSSLAYLDSWSGNELKAKGEKVFERLSLVLSNFYNLLNKNGLLIIGVPRNNLKSNSEIIEEIGERGKIEIFWKLKFDWKGRIKTWENHTIINGKELVRTTKSYLFTKEELKDLMEKLGFKELKLISAGKTHDLYDDFVVGLRT